jgi:hypothetical protein
MKKLLFILGVAILLMVTFYTSFESTVPQPVLKQKEKPEILQDHTSLKDESPPTAERDKQVAEWKELWISAENHLAENEGILSALKQKLKHTSKTFDEFYLQRIGKLEERNELLRVTLETYDLSEGYWEIYKNKYNLEMEQLIIDLQSISSDYYY